MRKVVEIVVLGLLITVLLYVASVSGSKNVFASMIALAFLLVLRLRHVFDATIIDISEPVHAVNATVPSAIASVSRMLDAAERNIDITSGHFAASIWDSPDCESALKRAIVRKVRIRAISYSSEIGSKAVRCLAEHGEIALRFYEKADAVRKPHFILGDGVHIRSEKRDRHWHQGVGSPPDARRPALIRYECPFLGQRAQRVFDRLFETATERKAA